MPVIFPCPITASRHSKQCLEDTHLHLLNPCFSLSFFCIYCYSPMPAPKILLTIIFFFLKCVITVDCSFFFQVERTIPIKQTNQPNPNGLLTLYCFNSSVIPDGKIVRNRCICWGVAESGPWNLPLAAPHELAALPQHSELCSCSRKPALTRTSISLHHSRIWGICSSSELYLEIWSWSNMDWSHT